MLFDEVTINHSNRARINKIIVYLEIAKANASIGATIAEQMLIELQQRNFIDSSDENVLSEIIQHLLENGIVSKTFAESVKIDRIDGGFLACLNRTQADFEDIEGLTGDLIESFEKLKSGDGKVFSDLEFNTTSNINLPFARLYVAIGEANGYFLASAMISTELYYRVANMGSLTRSVHHDDTEKLFADFVQGDAIDRIVASS